MPFLKTLRLVRTACHFPVQSLAHRLLLRLRRPFYRPPVLSEADATSLLKSLTAPDFMPPLLYMTLLAHQDPDMTGQLLNHLFQSQAHILNKSFMLPDTPETILAMLEPSTPLWKENYAYLEFLLPLAWSYPALKPADRNRAVQILEEQLTLWWSLPSKLQHWSVYGVARRILTTSQLLPMLPDCSPAIQLKIIQMLYQDSDRVSQFLEKDIGGNHLIKDLVALLTAGILLAANPVTGDKAEKILLQVKKQLLPVFESQRLPDGFHFERTPMYHAWVLTDLLDCVHLLQQNDVRSAHLSPLIACAQSMVSVLLNLAHSSGQLPMFGDSSLPQTPPLGSLIEYARQMLALPGDFNLNRGLLPVSSFPEAGYVMFRTDTPASLFVKYGQMAPKALPAHSHGDIGSFEIHVGQQPVIVDSGIQDYEPGLVRDYFRGTGAHNTIWTPGEDQAEFWGSFRVADYPTVLDSSLEEDAFGAKVSVAYESHNAGYEHRRSVYFVARRFWVIQDWLPHLLPKDRPVYSLLHIHPDCPIRYQDDVFQAGGRLLIMPFGATRIEWHSQSPWRENLNLYSPGFQCSTTGQLIAMTPRQPDCFGWVLIPYMAHQGAPKCEKQGEGVQVTFSDGSGVDNQSYLLTWNARDLTVATAPVVANL